MPPLSAKFELLPDEEKNLLSASLKKRFLPKAIIYMVLVFLSLGVIVYFNAKGITKKNG